MLIPWVKLVELSFLGHKQITMKYGAGYRQIRTYNKNVVEATLEML